MNPCKGLLLILMCFVWAVMVMVGAVAYDYGITRQTIAMWAIFTPIIVVAMCVAVKLWRSL